jgi:quercetin dioxygenase-like cupin family protein
MDENKKNKVQSELIAVPFSYKDLVTYQTGSVVSRTIIDAPEGTVTVFAFDKGQRLSTHSAPYNALVEVIDGTGVFQIEEKVFNIECGSQLIMPANKPHSVTADKQFKMTLIMIKAK